MSITNYEEVDAALKRLCEVEVALSKLEGGEALAELAERRLKGI